MRGPRRRYFATGLSPGDVVLHEQAGGGYGNPLERDPERVATDAWNEKISIEYARREHGVVLDPLTLKVDVEATRSLRESFESARGGTPQG